MDHPIFEITEIFPDSFFMQRHQPEVMMNMHTHSHIEILLPLGCELTYETKAGKVIAPDHFISVLWAQIEHKLVHIEGRGEIIIANLPMSELLSWGMPDGFLARLFAGELITAEQQMDFDDALFKSWHLDYCKGDERFIPLAVAELQARLKRQSIIGWNDTDRKSNHHTKSIHAPHRRLQSMIKFIAENYTQSIDLKDIAHAAGISKGYANGLFSSYLDTTITSYLGQLRIHHAKTALTETNSKVLDIAFDSGFSSLSRFYEVFGQHTGVSPRQYRQGQRKIPTPKAN